MQMRALKLCESNPPERPATDALKQGQAGRLPPTGSA